MQNPPPPPPAAAPRRETPSHPGSVYLLTAAGIPIYLHFTFILLLAFIAWFDFSGRRSPFGGLLLVILVFVSIALHELGHALMARRFGIKTENIVLYPIGGVARLRSLGEGMQEFWIALAGPAVNVVIAIGLYIALRLTGNWMPLEEMSAALESDHGAPVHLLQQLLGINVMLVIFNLVPAFPMDGGRVLRALLTRWLPRETATTIAARIGQGLAMLFMAWGLLGGGGPMLIFVGLFVFLAAGQESNAVRSVALTSGHRVRDAMITHFDVLSHGDSLGRAADLLIATSQQDFPVVGGSQVIGVLGRRALLQGLAEMGRDRIVAEVMSREFPIAHPDEDLTRVLERMQAAGGQPLLVFADGRLLGYVNQENMMEFLTVAQLARRAAR